MPVSPDIAAQFSAGLAVGLDPDSASGSELAAENRPQRTLTSLRSRWLHRLCPVCGHTFRPGDEVLVSPDGQVVHDLPGLRCHSGHTEAAAGQVQAQAFFVGLAEAWPLPADVPLMRLKGDHWLLAPPRAGFRRPACRVCGHCSVRWITWSSAPAIRSIPAAGLRYTGISSDRCIVMINGCRARASIALRSELFQDKAMTIDERFSRHRYLPGWNQDRLAEAKVILVGVGALGNAVAQCLALAGVGTLVLCDPDWIERSNLSRMPLFRERDIGRLKVEAAAAALVELAPTVVVQCQPQRLETGIGLGELRDAALTLGCLDSRAARLELAGRCGLVRAPWIDGGTGSWSGEIRVYLDPDGPCYGCGQEPAARAFADVPQHCGAAASGPRPAGASAPLSAAVGAHIALLAVRFLMGLDVPSGLLVLDGVSGTVTRVRQERDPGCPYHRPISAARRIPVGPSQRLRDLLEFLGPEQTPLAWNPVQLRVECPRCGFTEARPGLVEEADCPRCVSRLRSRTTLELSQVPPDVTLANLGIPAREILACRGRDCLSFIELTGVETI